MRKGWCDGTLYDQRRANPQPERVYTPHSFRHMLALHGDKVCPTREAFKAWSQNLSHENAATTISSYIPVSQERQRDILSGMR